ncbi:MAG: crotonase/enoyl-CoA hydratase family protein [Beijerinckiaceae bacterium]
MRNNVLAFGEPGAEAAAFGGSPQPGLAPVAQAEAFCGAGDLNALPQSLKMLVANYRELDVRYDPNYRAVWCKATPIGPPSFTRSMVSELNQLHKGVMAAKATALVPDETSPLFYVVSSGLKGIFNLGGDLQNFIRLVTARDRDGLLDYAHACVELIYDIDQSLGSKVLTVCVVQGDALGGGLEAALSFNVMIAEKGSKMGLPESLFNAFAGMGAYSLLSRKIGPVEAERMIMSGRIYLAEELHEMGVVTILAEPGRGLEEARNFVADNYAKHGLLLALNKVRRRVTPITYEELEEVTDIWVDNVLELAPSDLRRMELLAKAQLRRISDQTRNS